VFNGATLPGVHLNLGLHGAGVSVGPRGLHVGVNRRGVYTSAGIPGTVWIPKTPSGLKMQSFTLFVRSSSFPR
jgi:Protein of unknown function (DUF4236)